MGTAKLAIAGKGGVGKTTLSATLARALASAGRRVIAVDADPNNCLGRALGFPEDVLAGVTPLSEMRERLTTLAGRAGGGAFYELDPPVWRLIEEHLVEHAGVGLLVMGTVEEPGAGCVCPESAVLKSVVRALVEEEDTALVLDMEAGLEHLGRGTARHIGALLVVVEPTPASARTAVRIARLAEGLHLRVSGVVLNKSLPGADATVAPYLEGLEVIATLPFDRSLGETERVPTTGSYVEAVSALLDRLDAQVVA